MARTDFNYHTQAFRRNARHPGFWSYALPIPGDFGRYEIRTCNITVPVTPIPDRRPERGIVKPGGKKQMHAIEVYA
jgi:hypothetical protein